MRALGYSFFFITGLTSLVAATPYPQYGPLIEENDDQPLNVRAQPQVCNAVNAVVSVLKINKATPFCSSFLGIKTFTAQDSSTQFVAATITVTSTISQTTTTTVQTDTITHTETTTVATLPTVVETIVVPEASISTFTTTPPSATVTVTVYTTPGAARVKRGAASHEDRAIQLPPYVKVFGSSAVSKACSCLSLPTPTVTSTNIITQTTTETADSLATAVDIVSVTATTDLTITQSVTSFVPTTVYTTSVSVSVTTVTAPTPTFTQTVTKPYNSHCVNILSGGKIFTTVSPNRSLTYPFATTPLNGNGGEETFSQCCQLCYESADCAFYYAYPQSPGNWRCQIITTTSLIDQNVSPTCPKGLVPGATYSGSSNQFIAGSTRGIGPCYVLANQLP